MPSDNRKNEVHVDYQRIFGNVHMATAAYRGDQCPTCNGGNGKTKGRSHHGSTEEFRNGYDAIDWTKVRANARNN